MAGNIKGITISLDGETSGLDKALKGVNKRSKNLQSELRSVDRLTKFSPKNTELLAQKQKLLGEQVENAKDKLNQLKSAEKQVQEQFKKGDIGEDQYRAFKREIAETSSKLDHFQDKLKTSRSRVNKLGDAMRDTGGKMKDIGGNMSGMVTAPLAAGLGAITLGTEDYRQSVGRLETNAENAGISAEKVNDALTRLSGVTGDSGTNVEALSNLMATGFNEQGMLSAMDALSGAVVKFPDTLNIEGLADGLQETVATGKAVGPFAEMLERMGVDIDEFSDGLEKAKENGEAQNYVLNALADTGLSKVNEQYRKNNKELVESRESQASFQESIAKLGETLAPIMTKATEVITGMIDKFNSLSPSMQKIILIVGGLVATLGPLLSMVGMMSIGLSALLSPITLVVAAIAGLIAIGVLLWKNWDTVKAKSMEIWNSITEFFKGIWDTLKTLFKAGIGLLVSHMTKSWNRLKEITSTVWNAIKGFFVGIWDWFWNLFHSRLNKLKSIVSTVWNTIKSVTSSVWNGIKSFFSGIWDKMVSGVESMKDRFIGAWNGIKNGIKAVINPIIGFINKLINGIENMINAVARGVNSLPSFDIPDWVPKIGGGSFGLPDIGTVSLPNIPKLDDGKNYSPQKIEKDKKEEKPKRRLLDLLRKKEGVAIA